MSGFLDENLDPNMNRVIKDEMKYDGKK